MSFSFLSCAHSPRSFPLSTKEVGILKHLASKTTTTDILEYRLTPAQRSTKELLTYLAHSSWRQAELVITGDMSLFADLDAVMQAFDPATFDATIDANWNHVKWLIQWLSDTQLNETVTLFGRFSNTRINFLVEWCFGQLMAYKMQLFLQLKQAGRSELATPNLWMGVDKADQS